jgi:hypothetical protein
MYSALEWILRLRRLPLFIPFNIRPNFEKYSNLPEERISISLGYYIRKYLSRAGDNNRRGVGLTENHDIIEKSATTSAGVMC